MNYREVTEYVEKISNTGIVPGLDSIRKLCELIGNPQDRLKFVHIAGTNGKGSTLAYISTILRCAGYRVGRYISPVIFEYCEKIQVNERNITKKALCEGIEFIRQKCDEMVEMGLPHPSVFEVETALAFWYFEKKQCDIVVLETGMGGTLDATNVIQNTLACVIASVGMDHMKFLGNTLEEIAAQKAGIIKKNTKVICMKQSDTVMDVVAKKCHLEESRLTVSDAESASGIKYGIEKQSFHYKGMKKLEIPLAGRCQIANAVLAIDCVLALAEDGFKVSEEKLRKGLKETVWEGRFSVIAKKPLFIVDGAHNEDAAQKLADSIDFYFTNRRIIYIMGILKDKEYEKVIHLTCKYADQIITITPPENKRALNALDLAREIAKDFPNVTAVDSLEEAVEMSRLLAKKEDVIIAFGSLSYLGRLMNLVRGKQP